MSEPKQKQIDQELLLKLDTLRKSGTLNLGESNWYDARRPAIGGMALAASAIAVAESTASEGAASDSAADTTVSRVDSPRALSRLERRTIEKILASHGVTAQA